MSSDCIFCKIANKEIPSNLIYEDENVVAFNDLNPDWINRQESDDLTLYERTLPLRHRLGDLVASHRDSEGAHVVDELAEGLLCPLRLMLVLGVDLDCDGINVHNSAVNQLIGGSGSASGASGAIGGRIPLLAMTCCTNW